MGGCRCSYRNCTARSDGKTHLFHYPVFDKLRCREWILNARKKELLSLTVCQLKNRVVCQHHFRDDMFMNDEKNQLKLDAIPTENGPYCTDNSNPIAPSELSTKIRDEALDSRPMASNKKKSYLPLKYVDFLTNKQDDFITKNTSPPTVENVSQINIEGNILNPDAFINKNYRDIPENNVKIESNMLQTNNQNTYMRTSNPNNRKIKILSETVLSKPLSFSLSGNVLDLGNVVKHDMSQGAENIYVNVLNKSGKNMLEINVPQNQSTDSVKVEDNYTTLDRIQFAQKTPAAPQTPVSKSLPKQNIKLTPERRAAIAEKRSFNMKLRDYIEAGLNCKTSENTRIQTISQGKKIVDVNQESKTELFDIFDCKLRNMQNALLKKIEENTKQIAELKQYVPQENKASADVLNRSLLKTKDNCSTQTEWSLNELKRYLFNSVSEFISPELKNRLYEELFIDKFVENTESVVGKARRSKRRKISVQLNEP